VFAGGGGAGAPALAGSGGALAPQGGMASTGGATDGAGTAGAVAASGAGGSAPISHPKIRTVGYLALYTASAASQIPKIDFSLLTHINLAFAKTTDGNVSFPQESPQPDTSLGLFADAAHAAGVKVCVAIGGAVSITKPADFTVLTTPERRGAFIDNLVAFVVDNRLDCLDVDYEGSSVTGDYEGFVVDLATKLHAQQKEISTAVGKWFADAITTKTLQTFDWVNVMAYDLHDPYSAQDPIQPAALDESVAELEYFIGRGVAKDKAVFGVPFYGFVWSAGMPHVPTTYASLRTTYGDLVADDKIEKDGKTVYLNGTTTIAAKAKIAAQNGGIMAWEMGQDATGTGSLLKLIRDTNP
jgi:GH18 family chitinase